MMNAELKRGGGGMRRLRETRDVGSGIGNPLFVWLAEDG